MGELNKDRLPLARIVPDNSTACPPSLAARPAVELVRAQGRAKVG